MTLVHSHMDATCLLMDREGEVGPYKKTKEVSGNIAVFYCH